MDITSWAAIIFHPASEAVLASSAGIHIPVGVQDSPMKVEHTQGPKQNFIQIFVFVLITISVGNEP